MAFRREPYGAFSGEGRISRRAFFVGLYICVKTGHADINGRVAQWQGV